MNSEQGREMAMGTENREGNVGREDGKVRERMRGQRSYANTEPISFINAKRSLSIRTVNVVGVLIN